MESEQCSGLSKKNGDYSRAYERVTQKVSISLRQKAGAESGFAETPGAGIEGVAEGHRIRLGSKPWLEQKGARLTSMFLPPGSAVYLAMDGEFRGAFVLANALRPQTERLIDQLSSRYEIALLSGDNDREEARFRALFGQNAHLHFNQSPLDKLGFIRRLQAQGRSVMMVGDGLNDAGALKQSDVGVAVIEEAGAFSPASDLIMDAGCVGHLAQLLALSRRATGIVRWCIGISALYNLVGIGLASAGMLSPLVCAVLMPLSSVSVVAFACGATRWTARRLLATTRPAE